MMARSAPSRVAVPSGDRCVEHHRRTRTVGQQARRGLGEHGRVEPGLAVGQVERGAALPGLGVHGVAVVHEPGHVGDGVLQHEIVTRGRDGERLVEVGTRGRVERHERDVGAVGVIGRVTTCGGGRGGEHVPREPRRNFELCADLGEAGVQGVRGVAQRPHWRRAPMNIVLRAS
jgi:hypothetical protein